MADAQTQSAAPQDASNAPPQMPDGQVGQWLNRIKAAEDFVQDLRDREHDGWKRNVQAYMGKVLGRVPREHAVCVPLEFSYVELKKSQLAFQVPEVHLRPKNPQSAPAVPIFQAAVNHELGPENARVKTTVDECLTDVLLCGIAASKIGYTADIREREVPVMEPDIDLMTGQPKLDPQTQQPLQRQAQASVVGKDGMMQFDPMTGQPVMQPMTRIEPYVAYEEYFWRRFPVEQLLLPVDFEESDFDRAAWIGMKFIMDFEQAKKTYKLPPDFNGIVSTPRETLSSDERPAREQASTNLKQVEGYEIWYQASIFNPEENPLPKQLKKLVLIKGLNDRPAEWMDSPYQEIGPDGKLHGMEGYPIHPLTLRFLPGSAYPVSDVGIARPISEEISTGRTQMIQFRDRVLPMMGYDRTRLDPDTLKKFQAGEIGKTIGTDGDPREAFVPLSVTQFPRENFTFDEIGKQDYQETWAMRAPALDRGEAPTATEVNTSQAVSDVRLDAERTQVLNWFTRGATKFASLLQQFKDDAAFVEIEGPDGQQIKAWDRHMVQGEFVFTAKPDSALRIDADIERRQALALYNLLGRDPNVKRTELLKTLVTRHNMDPAKIVVETPPQEPKPEPPRISLSVKGEDLAPTAPQFPIVLELLKQGGIEISPDAIANAGALAQRLQGVPATPGAPQNGPPKPRLPASASPPHPGATPQVEPLSKHQLQADTGKLM